MTDTTEIRAEITEANEIAPWTIAWLHMTALALCDDLDKAEARIAAALAICDATPPIGFDRDGDTYIADSFVMASAIRRALTPTTVGEHGL